MRTQTPMMVEKMVKMEGAGVVASGERCNVAFAHCGGGVDGIRGRSVRCSGIVAKVET